MLVLRRVSLALLICALGAYVGILSDGRHVRDRLVDSTVLAARLADNGYGAVNTVFDPTNGSASIGVDYHQPSAATWTIAPIRHSEGGVHYLYVSADDPDFFSPLGMATITVDSTTVGVIKSQQIGAEPSFIDDPRRETILMPPQQTFGYRFPIDDTKSCTDGPCTVTVHCLWAFWHVFRFAVLSETPRFVAESAR